MAAIHPPVEPPPTTTAKVAAWWQKAPPGLFTLVMVSLVGLILYAGNTVDLLSDLTRPLVVIGLQVAGFQATDGLHHLLIEHLKVPWTGDCAGLNILAILLAVVFWSYRRGPWGWQFWLRALAVIPLAFLANLARIFSLIALRWMLYPATESPQLHYFIGFLWVLPFLGLLLRRPFGVSTGLFWLEILRIAAVLSMLAPFVNGPGGVVVTSATLLLLARFQWRLQTAWWSTLLLTGWMMAGVAIAGGRMESLWLPWLLTCPGFLIWRPGAWLLLLALLPATIPLVALNAWAPWVFLPLLLVEAWRMLQSGDEETPRREQTTEASAEASEPETAESRGILPGLVGGLHLLPFVAGLVALAGTASFPPPAGTMQVPLPDASWSVRIIGQAPDLSCFWFEPNEGGRHHTLPVCLRFRGLAVGREVISGVLRDNEQWLMEFFLMPDGRLLDYPAYLRATFWPFSSTGVHLIFAAPVDALTPEDFRDLSQKTAGQLAAKLRQE